MKSINLLSKTVLAAVIVVAFTFGCDNVTNPEPIELIDSTRTATVQGKALANLDETNDTTEVGTPQIQYESAPAGTKVKVVLDSKDYVLNTKTGGVQEEDISYTTELDGSGSYSLEIPVPNHAIDVKVYLNSFSTQVEGDDSDDEEVFTATPVVGEVTSGLSYFIPDVIYN